MLQTPRIASPTPPPLSLLAALCLALLVACGDPGTDAAAEAGEEASAPSETGGARLAALPGQDGEQGQTGELPSGHPPTEPPSVPPGHPPLDPSAAIPPVPEGAGTGSTALTWKVPEGWIEEAPASAMRRAQYRVPGEAGDGEMVVFYFGPGQGGTPEANARRWIGQFTAPDGSPVEGQARILDVGGMPVMVVEATGTYSGGMTMMGGATQALADHMLLAAIAQGPDANWFFKLTGPQTTLEAQRGAFESLVSSLKRGGE